MKLTPTHTVSRSLAIKVSRWRGTPNSDLAAHCHAGSLLSLTPISIFLLRNDKILAYLGDDTQMPLFTNIYIFFHRFTQFQPSQASSAGVASGFRRRSLTFPYQYCLVVTFSYMIGHKSIAKTQITKQNLYAGQISWAHAIPCPTFAMFREIFTST